MLEVLAISIGGVAVLWLALGYLGFGILKYHCVNVSPSLFGGGWNGGARFAAWATLFSGPFGLWSQISQIRAIREEYGRDKVPMGFTF